MSCVIRMSLMSSVASSTCLMLTWTFYNLLLSSLLLPSADRVVEEKGKVEEEEEGEGPPAREAILIMWQSALKVIWAVLS